MPNVFFRKKGIPDVPNKELMEKCYGTSYKLPTVLDWIAEFNDKYKDVKAMTVAYINWCLGKKNVI